MSLRLCTDAEAPATASGPEPKRFNDLQAKFALAGWALDPLHGQKLLLQRWGAFRVLSNLDEAEEVLLQILGART